MACPAGRLGISWVAAKPGKVEWKEASTKFEAPVAGLYVKILPNMYEHSPLFK